MFNADFLEISRVPEGILSSIFSRKNEAGDKKASKGSIFEATANRENVHAFRSGVLSFETSLRMYGFELLISFFEGRSINATYPTASHVSARPVIATR